MKKEFYVQREMYNAGIALHYREFAGEGKWAYAVDVTIKTEPEFIQTEPFMRFPMETAQQLMDELWWAGLRPTEGAGSAGSLKATQDHLEDMRLIAFNRLKINAS